jgi:anti-anti-sigma factor
MTALDDMPVVEVRADVDLANVHQLQYLLERAARADKKFVIVSLVRTSYIDSEATRALLRFGSRIATHRQQLVLIAPKTSVARRVLEITGVAATFPMFDTMVEAAAFLKCGALSGSPAV